MSRGFSLLRRKLLLSVLSGLTLLVLPCISSSTEPVGPFDVKLEISHLPRLNEEVALVCSVTSQLDLDSVEVFFWWSDTAMVKVIKGQKKHYCKFKKDETKVFELTVTFPAEGVFGVLGYAKALFRGPGIMSNVACLYIKTYKDKTAVLLERMPYKLPDSAFRCKPQAVRDSMAARAGRVIIKRR